MPFRHVVMFQWVDGLPAEHVERVREGLNALPGQIEQIRDYRHGHDVGITPGNFDYVVVADFDSADDFVTYRDHPVHQQLIEDLVKGNVATRAAVQYET